MLRFWVGLGVLGMLFGQTPTAKSDSTRWAEFSVQVVRRSLGLQFAPGYSIPIPQYHTESFQMASRADGAWALSFPDHRTVGLPSEHRVVTIAREIHSWAAPNPASFLRTATRDAACTEAGRGLLGNGHFDGWDEVLGLHVARYQAESGDSKATAYYAPELDCVQLKQTRQEMIWHGMPLVLVVEEAKLLQRGQSDSNLFQIPR